MAGDSLWNELDGPVYGMLLDKVDGEAYDNINNVGVETRHAGVL